MTLDIVHCPTCRKRVRAGAPHFPFCSNRCRLLDLGSWFAEDYRLSRPLSPLLEEDAFLGEVDGDGPEGDASSAGDGDAR